MKRLFFFMVFLISILNSGTSFGADITGTYKNKTTGAVLIIAKDKSGRNYLVTVKSKSEECSGQSKAELTKTKYGDYKLEFLAGQSFSDWGVTLDNKNQIFIRALSRLCDEFVDGNYKK